MPHSILHEEIQVSRVHMYIPTGHTTLQVTYGRMYFGHRSFLDRGLGS